MTKEKAIKNLEKKALRARNKGNIEAAAEYQKKADSMKKKINKTMIAVVCSVFLVLGGAGYGIYAHKEHKAAEVKAEEENFLFFQSRFLVQLYAKSPYEMKFEGEFVKYEEAITEVWGDVTLQNGFGAKKKCAYHVTFVDVEGEPKAIRATIDGELFLNREDSLKN